MQEIACAKYDVMFAVIVTVRERGCAPLEVNILLTRRRVSARAFGWPKASSLVVLVVSGEQTSGGGRIEIRCHRQLMTQNSTSAQRDIAYTGVCTQPLMVTRCRTFDVLGK